MNAGFDGSTLAVFTALTPSGAIAYACLALILLAFLLQGRGVAGAAGFARAAGEEGGANASRAFAYLRHLMALPLAVAWAGLVAAATHLGTPANALYAFTAVGTSPLSNEVTSVVAFLFLSGVYWLYGFARNPRPVVEALLLTLGAASVAALLAHTSTAYGVSTVPSWDSPLAPACIVTGAACAGLSMAAWLVGLAVWLASRADQGEGGEGGEGAQDAADARGGVRWQAFAPRCLLVAASLAALAASSACLMGYVDFLSGLGNKVVEVGAIAGVYDGVVALHGLLSTAGLALQGFSLWLSRPRARAPKRRWLILALDAAGCLLVLSAALLARFPFYEAYLSISF